MVPSDAAAKSLGGPHHVSRGDRDCAARLLGLTWQSVPVDLVGAEQRAPGYLALNPQGLVPTLEMGGARLTQSLAIIEYLHTTTPISTLLPPDPLGQYRVRQLSYVIAMEVHPVCNHSVARHVADLAGGGEETVAAWMQRYISKGLGALEALLAEDPASTFSYGEGPTMADCCLVPQIYNAERWGVDLSRFDRILRAASAARALPAVAAAHPDRARPGPA